MNRALAAVAITLVIALAALTAMETVGPLATQTWANLVVHEVLIGLAIVVTLALAALALRAFYTSGSSRSLVLACGLLAFAAIYTWHGAFTRTPPAFAFLIYGPASRVAFGLTLPFLLMERVVPRRHRFMASTGAVAGAAILAVGAWAMHGTLASWATGATATQLQTVRLSVEALAAGLAIFATVGLLLNGRRTPEGGPVGIAIALTLLVTGSAYFLATGPWSVAWWAAHGTGAASSLLLTWAIVGRLAEAERSEEINHLTQLNAMRTRFINAAAHELGTPLTPIQLQLSLLRSRGEPLTEQQTRSLDTIQRNVTRLADLTRSILEGARTQQGHFPIRLENADLRETLDDLERSYTAWCDEKGISFHVRGPARIEVYSDRRRIHQIISNYVSNAIKNTPAGGHIAVTAALSKERVRINVEDTGRGMTEAERRRLFQPFTQLDDPSKVVGSGLGLYIARQLAERLGGFVGVASAGLGHGSTFFVDLPTSIEGPVEEALTPEAAPMAAPASV